MKRTILLTLTLLLLASTAQAAITYDGVGFYPSIPLPATGGILGAGGDATLTVNDDSDATWTTLRLGWHNGYTGTLKIEDPGSSVAVNTLISGNAEVSHAATGFINITDGSLTVSGNTQLAANESDDTCTLIATNATIDTQLVHLGAAGTASATLTNSTWNSAGTYFVMSNSTGSSGSLSMTNSTLSLSPTNNLVFANADGTSATLTMNNSTINYTSGGSGYFGHNGDCNMTLTNGSVADFTGDPSDPATVYFGSWGASTCTATFSGASSMTIGKNLYIARGNRSSTMTVSDGSTLTIGGMITIGDNTRLSDWMQVGVETSHDPADQLHGNLTVTGVGSSANVGTNLYLGAHINGDSYPHTIATVQLDIDSSAQVNVAESTLVGSGIDNVSATLDMNGGTLNTKGLCADFSNITGLGTINTTGIVTNTTMVIDEASDLTQTINNGSVAINLNIDDTGTMGAGYDGTGTLTVSSGVTLTSTEGMLGHCLGSDGTATVTGAGTEWDVSETLTVGGMGAGTLHIANGAIVKTNMLVIDGDVAMDDAGDLDEFYYYVGYTGLYFGDPADQFDISPDSLVKLSNGGQLALPGNLTIGMGASDFLTAIQGSDEIEIMDAGGAWVDLASAVRNIDYTLTYDSSIGCTVLRSATVTVPEPSMIILLLGAMLAGWFLQKRER